MLKLMQNIPHKLSIVIVLLVTLSAIQLRAQKDNINEDMPYKPEKVVIFDYYNNDKNPVNNYYSQILSDLAVNKVESDQTYLLEKKPMNPVVFDIIKTMDEGSRIEKMKSLAGSLSADYLIVGAYSSTPDNLKIDQYVYLTRISKIEYVTVNSTETGVTIFATEEDLSGGIYSILLNNRYVPEEPAELPKSPYLGMYQTFSGWSIGFNYAKMFLQDDWNKVLENDDFANFYFLYDYYDNNQESAARFLGLSLEGNYFLTKAKSSWKAKEEDRFKVSLYGLAFKPHLMLHFTRYFILDINAGPGLGYVKKFDGNPFGKMNTDSKFAPFVDANAGLRLSLGALTIHGGYGYMRSLSPKPLIAMYPFLGMGIRF